ncbi:MAG: hypothetical protein E7256_11920 [Lachnospiraceae bacterium]|nr:hypothetical protein [Lachnospiraceae bacterium]
MVAIDGKCGAGKTTLGNFLKEVFDCNVFHMDDFFLQNEQRTECRLKEVGGNVDYERFQKEVILPVLEKKEVLYRPFRCDIRAIAEEKRIPYKRLNIIEGAYSQHPYFKECYQLRIFMDLSEGEQIRRIRIRNGESMLRRFMEEWIPKENAYFKQFHIREKSDLILKES